MMTLSPPRDSQKNTPSSTFPIGPVCSIPTKKFSSYYRGLWNLLQAVPDWLPRLRARGGPLRLRQRGGPDWLLRRLKRGHGQPGDCLLEQRLRALLARGRRLPVPHVPGKLSAGVHARFWGQRHLHRAGLAGDAAVCWLEVGWEVLRCIGAPWPASPSG